MEDIKVKTYIAVEIFPYKIAKKDNKITPFEQMNIACKALQCVLNSNNTQEKVSRK